MGHTLVDLPKNLDPAVLDRLKDTRISGQLINIQKDTGRPPRRGFHRDDNRDNRDNRGGRRREGGRRGDKGGRSRWRD